jgi:putative phage-type endonuclease
MLPSDFTDLVESLVEEFLDDSFVLYFKASFLDLVIQQIITLIEMTLEEKATDEWYDEVETSLENALQERFVVPRSILPCMFRDWKKKAIGWLQTPVEITNALTRIDNDNNSMQQQRSAEWYAMRNELLTATAVSHLFSSPSKSNEVIYEKCRRCQEAGPPLSIYDSRHWGVKYEPVSRMLYETLYRTKVKEYGCLRHSSLPFVGASPDGINVDMRNGERYGRMVEIKNVVSREITGEPLDDYWIQMQVQMEVCGLDLCDFVETSIKEFDTFENFCAKRYDYDYSGVVFHFVSLLDPLQNHYEYMPLKWCQMCEWRQIETWREKYQKQLRHSHRFVNTLYWYLEEFSCVVVPRNADWFSAALPRITEVWRIIERERAEGYEHRAAKRRNDADVKTILLMP